MAHLGIIVVNYNSTDAVKALYEQLHKQVCNCTWQLLIIDNQSRLDERAGLDCLKHCDDIDILYADKNLGFGPACNVAAKHLKSDYILLLNPDITLADKLLQTLVNAAITPARTGIWGAVSLNRHNDPDDYFAWREPSLSNMVGWAFGLRRVLTSPKWQDTYDIDVDKSESVSVDAVTGCCLLIDRQLWQLLNGFDERFFLYSEEIDLCRRARDLGYGTQVVCNARLWHLGQKSSRPEIRLALLFNGKKLYAQKHLPKPIYHLYWLVCGIGIGLRALLTDRQQRRHWRYLFKRVATNRLSYDC